MIESNGTDEAAALDAKAVGMLMDPDGADDPDQVLYLSDLGLALRTRFDRTDQSADLSEAIEAARKAAAAEPLDHPEAQAPRSNLGLALLARFERTADHADLDEAFDLLCQVIAATPEGHPAGPKHLSNLAAVLQARFEHLGASQDLDDAVVWRFKP